MSVRVINPRLLPSVILMICLFQLLSLSGITIGPTEVLNTLISPSMGGLVAANGRLALLSFIYLAAAPPRVEWLGAVLGGVLFTLADQGLWEGVSRFYSFLDGVTIAALVQIVFVFVRRERQRYPWMRAVLVAYGISLLFSFIPPSLLKLTAWMQPATHDMEMYRLDSAFGFLPSLAMAQRVTHYPLVEDWLSYIYNMLPAILAGLIGFQIARDRYAPVRIMDVVIASGFVVLVAYQLFPVAGPAYLFGANFPNSMPEVSTLPIAQTIVGAVPRNGMPSMHFAWALTMWLVSLRLGRLVSAFYGVMALLTVAATLGLGEHYLVDLVVAVPVAIALMALCSFYLPWGGSRGQALVNSAALYVVWLLAMWFAIPEMIERPAALWVLTAVTIAVSVLSLIKLMRANSHAVGKLDASAPFSASPAVEPAQTRISATWVVAMFFFSGLAALIYQVLFSKQLMYVFGSMSTATNTVLATYMGGIAIGSWLGGTLAPKFKRPLLVYALCELGIAMYCSVTPAIFKLTRSAYVALATGASADASLLLPLRVALGGFALVIPTIIMGMTLPLVARFFEQQRRPVGVSVSRLYAANTLGAAVGALSAGYFILPALGMFRTTMLTVAANLLVAFLAMRLDQRLPLMPATPVAGPAAAGTIRNARLAIVLLSVGGFITLLLEVDYVHLLAITAGNSTYAFSLMLFAFLVGLGAGSECGRWLMQRFEPVRLLAWLEFGLALVILLSLYRINGMPRLFADYAAFPAKLGFGAREIVRGAACCVAMMPPALFIGAIFPIAIEAVVRGHPDRAMPMLGLASALNTVGNIVGVILGGFVLLPYLGGMATARVGVVLALSLGVLAAIHSGEWKRPRLLLLAAVTSLTFVLGPSRLDLNLLTSGSNVYFYPQDWGYVIDHAESLDGGLTSINEQPGKETPLLTLLTNGKFQGNNSKTGEMVAQAGFALAPLLHVDRRDAALVVGFGTGNTSRIFHDAGFERLDIVDLSADVLRLADRRLASVNAGVLAAPGVHSYITDGRNFLLLSQDHYDVISMELTSIWFAGAASLYSKDYYHLAKARLTRGGVLQQWMQLHHATPLDLTYILGSVRAEFKYVWLYLIGGQGVIIASDDQTAMPDAARLDSGKSAALAPTLALFENSAASIAGSLLLSPIQIDKMLASKAALVSTDDNAFLEYSTPKGNVLDAKLSTQVNLKFLRSFGASAH